MLFDPTNESGAGFEAIWAEHGLRTGLAEAFLNDVDSPLLAG